MAERKEYGFNIRPLGPEKFESVYVEVYRKENNLQIYLQSRVFGRLWRRARQKEYDDAKQWAIDKINQIKSANEQ